MTRSESFNLKTDEIKEAITDYLNKKKGKEAGNETYFTEDIDGFSVHQSSEDIREYKLYIGFKQEVF